MSNTLYTKLLTPTLYCLAAPFSTVQFTLDVRFYLALFVDQSMKLHLAIPAL